MKGEKEIKKAFFVFYRDISEKTPTIEENERMCPPSFPKDWQIINTHNENPYDPEHSYSQREFENENQAVTWLRANIRSNFIYKIVSWEIKQAIKKFENAPTLTEVEEL